MQRTQIKILIVDDDPSFGKACAETIKREGYEVIWTKSPTEASEQIGQFSFQLIVVDCMLPQKSGIDWLQEVRTKIPEDTVVLLISGIYKDKAFIKEALRKTGATTFLTKPFDMKMLISHVADLTVSEEATQKNPIPSLFESQTLRSRKIVAAIDESDFVNGFELPFIYSLFMTAGITGQMNIVEAEGDIFGVTFSKGKIIAVETNDPPSFLGEILVEKDLLTKNDIEQEMSKSSEQKIGHRLIEANLLSPHMLDEVLVEQMEVRLTNTILDSSIEVNFVEADEIPDSAGIEMHNFTFLLARWFQNRVPQDWLKNYYLPWLDHTVQPGIKYSNNHPIFETTPFILMSNFYEDLIAAGTVQNLIEKGNYTEVDIFIRVHLLAITRCLGFGKSVETQDFSVQKQRMQKIFNSAQDKNYFEILNLSKNAKLNEIERSYYELSKVVDPQHLDEQAPPDLVQLTNKVFNIIKTAYTELSNSETRTLYLKEIQQKGAQRLLIADSLIEQGKKLLSTGQTNQAYVKFQEALSIDKNNPDIQAYLIWTRLKKLKANQSNIDEMKQIERDIAELTQSSQQNALLFFVKGLFQKEKGNIALAKSHFENAINLDNNFLEARREINVIKLQQKKDKPVDILHGDLKDVVGMLFRRK